MVTITYSGIDPVGNGRGGQLEVQSAWGFVSAAFELGWRELTVRLVDGEEIVGRIEVDPDGRRTWWGHP